MALKPVNRDIISRRMTKRFHEDPGEGGLQCNNKRHSQNTNHKGVPKI